jgi:uncharacterized membrane protein YcaP (DUF421 family)
MFCSRFSCFVDFARHQWFDKFLGTVALGLALAIAYRIVAALACKFHGFGKLLKDEAIVLVADGISKFFAACNKAAV